MRKFFSEVFGDLRSTARLILEEEGIFMLVGCAFLGLLCLPFWMIGFPFWLINECSKTWFTSLETDCESEVSDNE